VHAVRSNASDTAGQCSIRTRRTACYTPSQEVRLRVKIHWHMQKEHRLPFGRRSPDPTWFEPIGFPPPWPDRPWIYAVMVASANGVVAWQRSGPDDDPVLAILGRDDNRDERIVDRRHMRHLRCFGDVAIGAQTVREQPRLIQTPQEPGDEPMPALYRFRQAHGLPAEPRHVIYSLRGCLDLTLPIFNAPGVEVIVLTTEAGAIDLRACGIAAKDADLIVEPLEDPEALCRAHGRLFAERGVRYLDCEGGQTVLRALRGAGLLDEVFLTETDVVVDESRHTGVIKMFQFEQEGSELVAEGSIGRASPWRFRRWRFNHR
jgi:riboflavin biosynthesis pyrimidine reductase